MAEKKRDKNFKQTNGIGLDNPVFPKELMRRRWSQKEIVNVIYDDTLSSEI